MAEAKAAAEQAFWRQLERKTQNQIQKAEVDGRNYDFPPVAAPLRPVALSGFSI
jgi:hypothetical protein